MQERTEPKTIYLLMGPSGSGKSTMAEEIIGFTGKIFSTDDFFMKDGKYQFNPRMLGQAHQWNKNNVEEAMKNEISPIVVANTFTQNWERKPFLQMANQYGYKILFKEPDWHPELKTPEGKWNYEFLKGRNTHGVPDDKVKKMIDRYQYDPTVDEILKSKNPFEK